MHAKGRHVYRRIDWHSVPVTFGVEASTLGTRLKRNVQYVHNVPMRLITQIQFARIGAYLFKE